MKYREHYNWTERDYQRIIRLRKAGNTWKDIANYFGQYDWRPVRQFYYRRYCKTAIVKKSKPLPIDQIKVLWECGLSYREIGIELHLKKWQVGTAVRKLKKNVL